MGSNIHFEKLELAFHLLDNYQRFISYKRVLLGVSTLHIGNVPKESKWNEWGPLFGTTFTALVCGKYTGNDMLFMSSFVYQTVEEWCMVR